MKSKRKNKILPITRNEWGTLALIKEGMLGSCTHLMDARESEEVVRLGKFQKEIFPYPLSFSPRQKLDDLKADSTLELCVDDEIVGHIVYKGAFENSENFVDIFRPNTCLLKGEKRLYIHGDIELYRSEISALKAQFEERKAALNAQKITAIVSSFDPLHRAYERMFRWMIDKADLVLAFLIESYEDGGFDFALKERYLHKFIQSYLPPERVFVFPLRHIDIFHAHLNPGLESIMAKSLGCTKLIVGQNHSGLGMFYDANQPKSILDEFSANYGIETVILPEFVFCNKCTMIVSTRSCPHGAHHHLHYNARALRSLLRAGIIPPAVFMRKEISSMILSSLFSDRFKNLQDLYQNLFSIDGILEPKSDEEFYQKLLEVHQMSYMV